MILEEEAQLSHRKERSRGMCQKRSGSEPMQVSTTAHPSPGEEGVKLDLDPEPLEVVIGSKGPSQF